VPGADDIMLNYQSTSFHDALYVRKLLGLKPAPEFEGWLLKMGIIDKQMNLVNKTEASQKLLDYVVGA
jgi:ethanolamine ammonia-lyase large subunit